MTNQDKKSIPLKNPDLLSACIHCGLCLPACPTYLATGRETESPRGRIQLINLWQQGELGPDERLSEHINSCLGCMGCQTACPSGVQYEKILFETKTQLAKQQNPTVRKLLRYIFRNVLPNYSKLRQIGKLLRLWQSIQLDKLTSKSILAQSFLKNIAKWQEFLPEIKKYQPLPKLSWQAGEKNQQVEFFGGCVMDIFYNHVNHASIRLLTKQKHIVRVPPQTCCGALAAHAGEVDIATDLAKRNIEFFEQNGANNPIIVTSAGCGAMLKSYGELLSHDKEWHERAENFSKRIFDISEYLKKFPFTCTPKVLNIKVAYHAACHLAHVQKILNDPIDLLKPIAGLTLIELKEAEHCCGSAGIFNLTHDELSSQVLARKINYIAETKADYVVTTNPGCMLQIKAGIDKQGLNTQVVHLAEILDEAYNDDEGQKPS